MSQTNLPVTGREFKLMLNGDRFRDRAAGVTAFWKLVSFIAKKQGGAAGDEKTKEDRRVVTYLDTPNGHLRQQGLSLRQRREGETKFNLNLKHRSPDRYLSAARDVKGVDADKNEFEEDVLPPHTSRFSKSSRVKFKADPALKKVGDLVAIFPGVASLKLPADMPVETVNGFEAHEFEREVGKFSFGGPDVEASLSFWYLLGEEGELPLISEFSFGYPAESTAEGALEQFHAATVEGANRFFKALQVHAGWLDFDLTTKTAFVLDSA